MTLTLNVVRCPDAVPPELRELRGGEFSIGRGPDNDWVLPDPDRHLSKRHCVLAFRAGGWQLADTSTNGTFLNRDADPVGSGSPRDLRDGDRLRLGAYEIEVRIEDEAALPQSSFSPGGYDQSGFGQSGQRPAASPFGDDPFKAPASPPGGFGGGGFGGGSFDDPFGGRPPGHDAADPFGSGIGPASVALPQDFDPLGSGLGAPLNAPTQADHSSSLSDAFQPPRPAAGQIPDDWNLDLGPATPPSPAPIAPPPQIPPPPPAAIPSPFDEPDPFAAPLATPIPPPAPPPAPIAPMPIAATPITPPPLPVPPAPADLSLLGAFLHGAEMPDLEITDAAAKMAALGAAFRALVGGLRGVLMARAAIKGEFRIEQTMIRARGNNPLKFSTGDDDALTALLGAGRRSDMTPAAAVADALSDIRLHELASMAAMQSAVRALLQRLDPAPLRAAAEGGGLGLPGQRKARAWDEFEKLHAGITHALADDFDSVFGKAFARAYEQALEETAAKEKTP